MYAVKIDKQALIAEVPYLTLIESQGFTWDSLGYALNSEVQGLGPQANARRGHTETMGLMTLPKQLWDAVKREVFALFCTKARKYAAIRKKIRALTKLGTTQILTAITLWLSGVIGAAPAMLTPLVATALFAIASMGANAWCVVMIERLKA